MTIRCRWSTAFLALGIVLVAGYVVLALRARPVEPHPFFLELSDPPIAIAHRGSAILWPENTLYAFGQALRIGAQVIELDLRTTAEGVIVVLHDPTVDRTTNGSGRVNDLTLEEVRALDAAYRFVPPGGSGPTYRGRGHSVPTLDEVLAELATARLNLEIKEPGEPLGAALCERIRAHGAQNRVLVASFHASAVRAFRRHCPEVATSATFGEALRFLLASYVPGTIYVPPAHALQLPVRFRGMTVINSRTVHAAAAANLPMYAFTINEPGLMNRLLELGIHGVVTDRPDLALELSR